MRIGAALILAALVLAGCHRASQSQACPAPARLSPITGFCLPRWVSLKSDDVDGRRGPGTDYPALFVYHVRGLPVQVIEETTEWRRICDPDGGVVWVNRSMIDGRRTAMALGQAPAPMRRAADAASPLVGLLNPRALASVRGCQGGWCKVSAQGRGGWVAAGGLWGASEGAMCR